MDAFVSGVPQQEGPLVSVIMPIYNAAPIDNATKILSRYATTVSAQ